MKMKTKDLALLVLLFVGLKAFAQSTTIGNVTYEVLSPEEKTACCKAANTSISSASIASTVEIDGENYTVTMVKGRGFFNCKKLQSVSMPKTIEVIGDTAFCVCI